jgi:hypothetical protein
MTGDGIGSDAIKSTFVRHNVSAIFTGGEIAEMHIT